MSLADPLWLLALALIPAVLVIQRLLRRRARTYAVRFTAVSTLREALDVPGGWRRWLPIAVLMAALAALAVALARPHISHRVPIRDASLVLVLDHSGSMAADDVKPTRIAAAIRAANSFVAQLPSSIHLGAIGFSSQPDAAQRPIANHGAAQALIDHQQAGGGTATGPALQLALQLLDAANPKHGPAAIVLLSDGAANAGISPVTVAAQARRQHVPIYTVALGTPGGVINVGPFSFGVEPVPPDPQLMAQIARTSGGRSFDAQTADHLNSIYQALGRKLSSVARSRDVTVYALIIAAVLLLVALAASVRTAARLP
jgi:Ca-activated chloride channel family protein